MTTKHVFFFGDGKTEGDPKRRDLLGGKGAGLAEMTSLQLPVPPGFTISTEACNAYAQTKKHAQGLAEAVAAALAHVEASVGAKLGDPHKPLLVSVRSGGRASMPGMMDTILNLGLNDETVEALAKTSNNRRFAMDAYRRFVAMYSSIALGLDKEPFEHALDEARIRVAKTKGVDPTRLNTEELKRSVPDSDLPEAELEALVRTFKGIVKERAGRDFPSDPSQQLWGAIEAVFASWNNARAAYYRKLHDIPDSWGTACNVQAMVFGNLGNDSATGVAFTRDPSTGDKKLFGEWLPNAQGEDVVAGIRTPLPIRRDLGKQESLEDKMPSAFAELARIAGTLESHFRDMQDLEFTIQNGRLYMLQCRNGKRTSRAAVHIAVDMVREKLIDQREAVLRVEPESLNQLLHPTLDPKADKKLLARGLAASPGAASGQIVFDADEAKARAGQGLPVILVRVETSPEDIQGMQVSHGILTARGGMTSHAAVVARGMGKPCVAGTTSVQVRYDTQTATFSMPDGPLVLKKGDQVTIDGATGEVFLGAVATVPAGLFPELENLLGWADELRRLHVRANADTPHDARTARAFGAEGIGLCRTEHMFFGEERIDAMREMILAESKVERERALEKLLPHQRTDFVGIFRAMDGLPVTIRLLDPPLHEFLPNEPKQVDHVAKAMGLSPDVIVKRAKDLHEFNPMLGHRGCRLAITFPEIYAMQARAILEAAMIVKKEGVDVRPEIMIPLAISKNELDITRAIVDEVAAEVKKSGPLPDFAFGTMIELPRAALLADELAKTAEFFSFGTNDLTQATMGLSRDDAGRFLPSYLEGGILPKDPFVSIDVAGVGQLVRLACERGQKTRPNIKLGVCGEHGGDPASIGFFHEVGLAYVSCSPFRVIIARLAAAQVAAKGQSKSTNVGTA